MAQDVMYSGANKVYLFDPTVLTTPMAGGTLTFSESAAIVGHPAKGVPLVIDIANKIYDEDTETLLAAYLRDVDVEPSSFNAEDGSKKTVSSLPSTAVPLIGLHFSPLVGSKYMVTAGVFVLSGASGDISTGFKQLGDAPIQLTSVKVPTSYTITTPVIAALGPTGITGADITIAASSYGTRAWQA